MIRAGRAAGLRSWSVAVAIVGVIVVGTVACSDGPRPSARSRLQQHQEVWRKQNIKTYSFTFTASAMCGQGSVRVSVKDGVASSTSVISGRCGTTEPPRTIDAVFHQVQEERTQWGRYVTVRYDAAHGFPVSLAVDDPSSFDEEHGFTVTAFRAGT